MNRTARAHPGVPVPAGGPRDREPVHPPPGNRHSGCVSENLASTNLCFPKLCGIHSRFSTGRTQSLPRSGRSWATDSPRSLVLWCSGSHQEASRNGKPDESRGRKAIGPSVRFPPDHGSLVPEMKRRSVDPLYSSPPGSLPRARRCTHLDRPIVKASSLSAACRPWGRERGPAAGSCPAACTSEPDRSHRSQPRLDHAEAVPFVPSLPAIALLEP